MPLFTIKCHLVGLAASADPLVTLVYGVVGQFPVSQPILILGSQEGGAKL